MEKLSIKNIKMRAQKLFSHDGIKKDHGIYGADSVWAILLGISVLIIIATSMWHLRLFVQVKNDKIFQVSGEGEENSQIEINIEALEEVISQFDEKKARFDAFIKEKPYIIDPSL